MNNGINNTISSVHFLSEQWSNTKVAYKISVGCGKKAILRTHDKRSEPSKTVLSCVYGISVETETEDIFPPRLCNSCFLCLRRSSLSGDNAPILNVSSWTPHSDACPVCTSDSGGRPKKKRGRPSDADEQYIIRNILQTISRLSEHTQQFADFPLEKSMFLPSPHTDYLACQICQCIPSRPIETSNTKNLFQIKMAM